MDSSDVGVGRFLSQRAEEDSRLHPCTFFSLRLAAVEKNYDVGNREPLAVKLALEEQRPKTRIQPTSRQLKGWFNFTLTWQPGSQNIKLDGLSRRFPDFEGDLDQETNLPSSCVLAFVSWVIQAVIQEALWMDPDPGNSIN